MAIGRAERFEQRKPRIIAVFGDDKETLRSVSELLTLMEMAWHDCYGEITPADDIVEDILLCSGGTLGGLIDATHLAVIDHRDLSVRASTIRTQTRDDPNSTMHKQENPR
jgi:hypothetical protein